MKKPEYIKISDSDAYAIYRSSSNKTNKYRRIKHNCPYFYEYYIKAIDDKYKWFVGCGEGSWGEYESGYYKIKHLTEEEVFLEML